MPTTKLGPSRSGQTGQRHRRRAGKLSSGEELVGSGSQEQACGLQQQRRREDRVPRRPTRASATARTKRRGASSNPGSGGIRLHSVTGPQGPAPRPNPKARQAQGPRACPTRATTATMEHNKRCRSDIPSSSWRFCPSCGNPLSPPPSVSNPNTHSKTPPAGPVYEGRRLNPRPPRHGQGRNPISPPVGTSPRPSRNPRPNPDSMAPPKTYAQAVRRVPPTNTQRNSRGAFGPSRNHAAPPCVRVCV